MGEGAAGGENEPLVPCFSPAVSAPVRSGGLDDAGAGFQPRDLAGRLVSARLWATCCLGNRLTLQEPSALPVIYSPKPQGDP